MVVKIVSAIGMSIRERHPLKQGLKLLIAPVANGTLRNSGKTSTKTRIETGIVCDFVIRRR